MSTQSTTTRSAGSSSTTHGAIHIPTIGSDELDRLLADGGDLLVWVTTSWCGPCRTLAPHLDALAAEAVDRVRVVALDGDENLEVRSRYRVAGFPTLMLFHDGVRVWQRAGALERSLEEVRAKIAPMLSALDDSEGGFEDVCPSTPTARPERSVEIPVHGDRVQFHRRTPDGRQALEAGSHVLSGDEDVVVTVLADHRLSPPLDWSPIEALEAGSVDTLEIAGAEADFALLASIPALSGLTQLSVPAGITRLDERARATLPALRSLNATLSADSIDPVDLFLDDEWVHPRLRGRPGVKAPGPRRTALVPPPVREVTDDDILSATSDGVSLLVFVLTQMSGLSAVSSLLTATAESHSGLRVLLADVDRCPRAAARMSLQGVPAAIVFEEGAPAWRTDSLDNEVSFTQRLDRALAALPMPRTEVPTPRTTPKRSLNLPGGPLDFQLRLQPADLGSAAATEIVEGGRIEVPAGWTVMADVGTGLSGDDTGDMLLGLGPDDIDVLYANVVAADLVEGSRFRAALTRLTGLSALDLAMDEPMADAHLLASCMSNLGGLRVLNAYAYTSSGSEVMAPDIVATLRPVLPHAVINGEWNALGMRE